MEPGQPDSQAERHGAPDKRIGEPRLPLPDTKSASVRSRLAGPPGGRLAARVRGGLGNGDEAEREMALAPCFLSHPDVRQFDIPVGQGWYAGAIGDSFCSSYAGDGGGGRERGGKRAGGMERWIQ